MSTESDWQLIWLLPNCSTAEAINAPLVALVSPHDPRAQLLIRNDPTIETLARKFTDEFGVSIEPSLLIARGSFLDLPDKQRVFDGLTGFRNAIAIAAICHAHAVSERVSRAYGVQFSDAFDVYPWMPAMFGHGRIATSTPAQSGIHSAAKLRPQCAPALGVRSLQGEIDEPLLASIFAHWTARYANSDDNVANQRLFRSLEMARAACRMPGGTDGSMFDAGRAVALWVSAFEILVHDGNWAGVKRVKAKLEELNWMSCRHTGVGPDVLIGPHNARDAALALVEQLYRIRNDFLHGNPVTADHLRTGTNGRHVFRVAAPLYRLLLTSFLKIEPKAQTGDDEQAQANWITECSEINRAQREAEQAVIDAFRPQRVTLLMEN